MRYKLAFCKVDNYFLESYIFLFVHTITNVGRCTCILIFEGFTLLALILFLDFHEIVIIRGKFEECVNMHAVVS